MSVVGAAWGRLTLPGKVLAIVVPILIALTIGLVAVIVVLGPYLVDLLAANQPFRMRIHDPSFVTLQVLPLLLPGNLVADTMAIFASLDAVMGGVDK